MTTLPKALQKTRVLSLTHSLVLLTGGIIATLTGLSGCSSNGHHTPAPIVEPQTMKPSQQIPQQIPQQPILHDSQQNANVMVEPQSVPSTITQPPSDTPTTNQIAEQTETPATTPEIPPVISSTPPESLASSEAEQPTIQTPEQPISIKNESLINLKRLVVLLPDRPSLQQVNRDIVQGIRQAHKLTPVSNNLEIVVINDDLPPEQLVNKVNSFAPDAIIGPLTKTDIQATSQLTAGVQVALNRNPEPDHRVQIGLAPEDELKQLLGQRKYKNLPIVVLTSNDPQDKRLLTGLEQILSTDGTPILSMPYSSTGTDINKWLKQDGNLENSQKRITALKQVLKQPVEAEPRLRRDIQAFISLSSAKNTRSIIPALRYYQVPWKVLATSKILPSRKGSDFHEPDLNGMEIVVPPYLLNDGPIQNAFEALGFDAYLLLSYREVSHLSGQTGQLTTQHQQVYRQLEWRKINKGQIANWQPNPNAVPTNNPTIQPTEQ